MSILIKPLFNLEKVYFPSAYVMVSIHMLSGLPKNEFMPVQSLFEESLRQYNIQVLSVIATSLAGLSRALTLLLYCYLTRVSLRVRAKSDNLKGVAAMKGFG